MWTRQHRRRNTGRLIVPVISAAFLAYFGFHAYHGEFGIYSKYRFEARMAELQAELATVKGERVEIGASRAAAARRHARKGYA